MMTPEIQKEAKRLARALDAIWIDMVDQHAMRRERDHGGRMPADGEDWPEYVNGSTRDEFNATWRELRDCLEVDTATSVIKMQQARSVPDREEVNAMRSREFNLGAENDRIRDLWYSHLVCPSVAQIAYHNAVKAHLLYQTALKKNGALSPADCRYPTRQKVRERRERHDRRDGITRTNSNVRSIPCRPQ